MAVDYLSYHLIHELQRYDDSLAFEIQKKRKKVVAEMKDQAFNWQDSISFKNVLTEYKRVCDSLRIQEATAV